MKKILNENEIFILAEIAQSYEGDKNILLEMILLHLWIMVVIQLKILL